MSEESNKTAATEANDESGAFDFMALLRPVRKHWLLALSITILVTAGTILYTKRQTKIYEASSTVQFDPNPPRPLGSKVDNVVELGNGALWDTREYYETQYQIIQSRRVSLQVVHQLGLAHDPGFLLNLAKDAPRPAQFEPWDEEDAAEVLRGRLRVEPVKQSRLAMVRLQDADPERAAQLLRALVKSYTDLNVDTALESTDKASKWLGSERDKLASDLQDSETQLHAYKEDNNILSVEFDDKSNMLREEIAQLNQTLTTIRTRKEEIAARRSGLAKIKADDPSVLPATELLQSDLLRTLRQDYIDSVRVRDGFLKGGKGKNHPDVREADAKVEISKEALLAEVKNIQGALDGDLWAIARQEGGVSGLFERAKKEALELNRLEIEYNRLRRGKENTEKLYSLILERSKESDLSLRLNINNVSVVDEAVVPRSPIRPNVPLNAAAGLAVGLLLGVGAAIGRAALDRTLKTPADVEENVKGTFLGLIPQIADGPVGKRKRREALVGAPELIVHFNPMSGTAEASRSVRTNLLFSNPDRPYRVLLVTSAGTAEGKTTVATCIATAMAQAGKRVLLIDCDLRRPRVHRIFGGRKDLGPGLTTALLDPSVEDCAVATEVPNLFVIPAGPVPPNPSELLSSERFKAFLASMRDKFDQVILDSPPIGAVTDGTILSTIADGTVLVVRAFVTNKDLARHARRMLNDVGAPFAGVVLNAVNLDRTDYAYAYHYYRRDGYYAEGNDTQRPPS